jgi:hypothetical protein
VQKVELGRPGTRQGELPVEEARAYEGIGRSHMKDGKPAEAIANLRHALRIYQHIGAAGADRTQAALRGAIDTQ